MKVLQVSVMAAGLAALAGGCAMDGGEPTASTESAVTENANNFVLACGGLALRTFDDPNAPVKTFSDGRQIFAAYGDVVHVGQVDWVTRMASVDSPFHGWMRIDGANGPLLSAAFTGCN